jgi:hypothetical protein
MNYITVPSPCYHCHNLYHYPRSNKQKIKSIILKLKNKKVPLISVTLPITCVYEIKNTGTTFLTGAFFGKCKKCGKSQIANDIIAEQLLNIEL